MLRDTGRFKGGSVSPRAACLSLGAVLLLALGGCGQNAVDVEPILHDENAIPDRLADWGLVYEQSGKLLWSEPLAVYDLSTPLFTDYAHKLRTVYLPTGTEVATDDSGQLHYPIGTIFSKTFYYSAGDTAGEVRKTSFDPAQIRDGLDLSKNKVLETRLLVHYESGWKAISYVWNDAQSEARHKITGAIFPLTLVDEQGAKSEFNYVVPDANQCLSCHATAFNTRQAMPIGPAQADFINRDSPLDSGNQLADWQQRGWLKESSVDWPAAPNWQDPEQSIAARARAYLEINCAHCHSATGAGDTSGLWLNRAVESGQRLGVCKAPIAAGQGTGGKRWGIHPGQPEQSILHYRMASRDPGAMMPELGRSLVHQEGLALVEEWISGLAGECREGNAGLLGQLNSHP